APVACVDCNGGFHASSGAISNVAPMRVLSSTSSNRETTDSSMPPRGQRRRSHKPSAHSNTRLNGGSRMALAVELMIQLMLICSFIVFVYALKMKAATGSLSHLRLGNGAQLEASVIVEQPGLHQIDTAIAQQCGRRLGERRRLAQGSQCRRFRHTVAVGTHDLATHQRTVGIDDIAY